MTVEERALRAAITRFNVSEQHRLIATTGMTWVLHRKVTFAFGATRARAVTVDATGRYWVDGALLVESLNVDRNLAEAYHQAIAADSVECRDLWVMDETRGRWNALITPVVSVARVLDLDAPLRMPDGQWARTWADMPFRTDEQELAWIASGGRPLAELRGAADG